MTAGREMTPKDAASTERLALRTRLIGIGDSVLRDFVERALGGA